MRRFLSYGPIDTDLHYHVPRTKLIAQMQQQVLGEVPEKGGHYITVWAPRQRGKTWITQKVMWQLRDDPRYDWLDVVKLNLQDLQRVQDPDAAVRAVISRLFFSLQKEVKLPKFTEDFHQVFTKAYLEKPLLLILDEFDSLRQEAIGAVTTLFRNIYLERRDQSNKTTDQKTYLLHGVALIGVRSVLGVENRSGSPFNVQRSVHIPNLTADEVNELFQWYQRESGQEVEQAVIDRLYYELNGQPGLTSWFGELLTETYNEQPDQPITMEHFDWVYENALNALPNSNIVNIVSKAREPEHQETVLGLFQTQKKVPFKFDNDHTNYLYLNGIIDIETVEKKLYIKFANAFIQRRLFNAFTDDFPPYTARLYGSFEDLSDTITETDLNVKNLMRRYERYFKENKEQILRHAPQRQTDLRIYEAIYHFHLFKYLSDFLEDWDSTVIPEFPTGNGKIDIQILHGGQVYGLELKSYSNQTQYKKALTQAANYANQMRWSTVWLVLFVERIDEQNRTKYEAIYRDPQTQVVVAPVFVETL